MKTRKNYFKHFLFGTLVLLAGVSGTSCSDDTPITSDAPTEKKTTLTFRIDGIGDMKMTRAAEEPGNVAGLDIFEKYTVKLYLFAEERQDGVETEPDNPYPGAQLVAGYPKPITESTVQITGLDCDTYNYCYVFVACEDDYADKLEVKAINVDGFGSGLSNISEGSLYTNCCIQVLDEDNNAPFDKNENAEDFFMVYGAGEGITASTTEIYQPVSVVLRRQMGAVVFNAGNIEQEAECGVFTEFYRLYLSQIVEKGNAGTRNHAHNGYLIGTDASEEDNPYIDGDYAWLLGEQTFTQNFSVGTTIGGGTSGEEQVTGYVIYLPCTTMHEEGNVPNQEYANVDFGSGNSPKTYITIGGKTYSTTQPFPIFPNRRTILSVGDGSTLTVSFTGEGGGINYEDDWNGGVTE